MSKKTITNTVEDQPTIAWATIKGFTFNNLKSEKGREVAKLKLSILENGFTVPFILWRNKKETYVVDGTGRKLALELLEYEGHAIEDLPVIYVKAKNLTEAKKKVLAVSSSYGEVDAESWRNFTSDLDLDDIDLAFVELDGFDPDSILKELDESDNKKPKKGKTQFIKTCPHCGEDIS
jgi:hypothetical protein